MKKVFLVIFVCACAIGGYFYWNKSREGVASSPFHMREAEAPGSTSSIRDEQPDEVVKKIEQEGQSQPTWMTSSKQVESKNAEAEVSQKQSADDERIAKMQKVFEKAQMLQSKPNVTPAEAIQTLREIEEANGSSNLNGVRLDVLRGNLEIAAKMKALAEEMQVLQTAAAAKKPGSIEQMQQKLKEAESLQNQIKTDFYAGPNLAKQ